MSSLNRIEVTAKNFFLDIEGKQLRKKIREELGVETGHIMVCKIYSTNSQISEKELFFLGEKVFADKILQRFHINFFEGKKCGSFIVVGFKPGVTDNEGITATEIAALCFDKKIVFYSSKLFVFKKMLSKKILEKIALLFLANPLIQNHVCGTGKIRLLSVPEVRITPSEEVREINLDLSKKKLEKLSSEMLLALQPEELVVLREHLKKPSVLKKRKKLGLTEKPTDVELECFAQTQSEHCKHKVFNAEIVYKNQKINGLLKTFIAKATKEISNEPKKKGFCVSVFKDNAGIISFTGKHNLAFKVETHNSPSALDPYGGALTGVLGVNRDILGTGLGAKPLLNTDILCFASPFTSKKSIPETVIHPKRLMMEVVRGIQDAGNKTGIPTVNGSIFFDESYMARPLVYCGTIGIMPKKIKQKELHKKRALNGDLIVMIGNRIGKDGIHGATFSSTALNELSPTSAVQIGSPIIQKRFQDFLMEAQKKLLYNSITDNGAGGLSSSVGEMALECNGAELWLDKPPLKYAGLKPWEILVSEAQERMTLAVPPEKMPELKRVAEKHWVECTVIGKFNSSGYFHCKFREKTVLFLSLKFLHYGLPKLKLKAEPENKELKEPVLKEKNSYNQELFQLLSHPNIASKESIVRRFDHEVQGTSITKLFSGEKEDGPSNAAVLKPFFNSWKGIIVSHGICPLYSEISCYDMAANALDEAVRNAVCSGADPEKIAVLDNFCWPNPKYDPKENLEGKQNLAKLVEACKACYDLARVYKTPFISGKDSLSSDKIINGKKYSIKPSLLISALGIIKDVRMAVSMDVKKPGSLLYVLGETRNELGASHFYLLHKKIGANAPKVEPQTALKCYKALHKAVMLGLIESSHDASFGGLAVALAETAFSGGFGLKADLEKLACSKQVKKNFQALFSETPSRIIVTVNQKHKKKFESLFKNHCISLIGKTTKEKRLEIKGFNKKTVINASLEKLKSAWQKTFKGW